MVFVGMLALSSQVIAKEFRGSAAQEILRKGDVVAEAFTNNGRATRITAHDARAFGRGVFTVNVS